MIIKTLTVGDFRVNNYLVIDEETKEAVVIDAGGEFELLQSALEEEGATLKAILNTHGHLDHIAGNKEIQDKLGAKVYIHKDDEFLLENIDYQREILGLEHIDKPHIDVFLEDGQELVFGSLKFKVIQTKGHSKGSVCFLIEDKLFVGDTLFAQSIGRTDLPGGDYDEIECSITDILFKLDDEIICYPGHGMMTKIGFEKKSNPFFGESSRVC